MPRCMYRVYSLHGTSLLLLGAGGLGSRDVSQVSLSRWKGYGA